MGLGCCAGSRAPKLPPMTPRYAEPGTIPAAGEVWQPVGPTTTLLTAHLVPVAAVAPLVPKGLEIVRVLPGRTVASTLLSYYGPGSTLVYNELVVACALVRCGGATGFFVSHIYVDSEASVTGGRRMGLPKEMATFDWDGARPGVARIGTEAGPLCTIRYGRPLFSLRVPISSGSISVLDDGQVMHFGATIDGRWGAVKARIEVPAGSALSSVPLGRPVVALASGPMRGEMGLGLRAVGRVAPRVPARVAGQVVGRPVE